MKRKSNATQVQSRKGDRASRGRTLSRFGSCLIGVGVLSGAALWSGAAMVLAGCSSSGSTSVASPQSTSQDSVQVDEAYRQGSNDVAIADGVVALAGPIPAIQPLSEIVQSAQALGFSPVESLHDGHWLSIEMSPAMGEKVGQKGPGQLEGLAEGVGILRLMDGAKEILRGEVQISERLRPGTFSVKHKQRNAPWYAPDEYFTSRGLPVPGAGEKGRFLRGALGDFALFIDKETPLYSGPVATPEIGGVRAEESLLSRAYYSLDIGAPIEVR